MRKHPWLAAILAIVVFCAALYAFVEWRAERRWQEYATSARARGVKILLTEFARPEIPDAQNFAALPMMRAAFADGSNPFELPGYRPEFGDPFRGKRINWVEWQKYFRTVGFLKETSSDPVRDVLQGLEHYAPQFLEWSEWRTRLQCRFPLDLTNVVTLQFPHLHTLQSAEKIFALRMGAHLARRDSAAAYDDFREGLHAYGRLERRAGAHLGPRPPIQLYTLVRSVGDGLQDHAWTETDLQKLESDLGAIQVWEDYRLTLDSERCYYNSVSEALVHMSRRERGKMRALFVGPNPGPAPVIVFQLLPTSVFRDNQLRLNQYFEELEARINSANQTFDPDRKTPSSPESITSPSERSYYFLFRSSGPVDRDVESRYIRMQTLLDQARLACALERFRAARGAYPATLAELAPEFITTVPSDIYARASYHYQREGEGSFHLYGVGEDRRDDGGKIDRSKSEGKQSDVIWPYAPMALP